MNDLISKLDLKALLIRTLIYIPAIAICSLAIGCYYTATLGTDPISVFVEGISFHVDLSVGEISTICNVILFILIFFLERGRLGLGTVLNVFLSGPLIDVFYDLLRSNFPPESSTLAVRIAVFAFGALIYGLGLDLTISLDMGIGPFSFPPLFLSRLTGIDLKYTQVITDALFFVIGMLLGGVTGIGTLISVLITGPTMGWYMSKTQKWTDRIGPIRKGAQ